MRLFNKISSWARAACRSELWLGRLGAALVVGMGFAVPVAARAQELEAISQIVSTSNANDRLNGLNINNFLGADRFYNAGFTGARAIQANIEAGHAWNGHETLGHVSNFITGTGAAGEVDRHATWVSQAMGGRGDQPHQTGIAPDAELWSGAIATQWNGTRFATSFSASNASIASTYATILKNGVNGQTADVFNSSWGGGGPTGFNVTTVGIDGILNDTGAVGVISAGNSGPGGNSVGSPGAGYNAITVGALRSVNDGNPFNRVASFSSRGPNDFAFADSPTSANLIEDARAAVDIAAPGQNLTLAYYGGQTGGNGPGLNGPPSGPPGSSDSFSANVAGTSFAAPIVAGGASLLVDAGKALYSNNNLATDGRVIKAVLLNSADKTQNWDNGQTQVNGKISTDQSLDYAVGAGRMNLDRAFDQFVDKANGGLAGTTDAILTDTTYDGSFLGATEGQTGVVDTVGWDFGTLGDEGALNTFFFDTKLEGGSLFTATLTWFADRISGSDTNFSGVAESRFADLNLVLFEFDNLVNQMILDVVAESVSIYNVVEHFSFELPRTGYFGLAVHHNGNLWNFNDLDSINFGLAWSGVAVPEPGTLILTLSALGLAVPLYRWRLRGARTTPRAAS